MCHVWSRKDGIWTLLKQSISSLRPALWPTQKNLFRQSKMISSSIFSKLICLSSEDALSFLVKVLSKCFLTNRSEETRKAIIIYQARTRRIRAQMFSKTTVHSTSVYVILIVFLFYFCLSTDAGFSEGLLDWNTSSIEVLI